MSEVFVIFHETQDYDENYPRKEITYIVETEEEATEFVDNKIREAYNEFKIQGAETLASTEEHQRIYEQLSDDAKRVLYPRGGPNVVNKYQITRAQADLAEFAQRYYDRSWSYEKYKTGLPDGA